MASSRNYLSRCNRVFFDDHNSSVIKSHHNVGGLPERMNLKLLEPIRELFKDEVRKIGAELNTPKHILQRHPFPGPGLGIRVMGEITQERIDILQKADKIFIDELKAQKLYDSLSQAFVVYLPIKSVGVVGDERRYEDVLALRAVETVDFMTANWHIYPMILLVRFPTELLMRFHLLAELFMIALANLLQLLSGNNDRNSWVQQKVF